MRSNRQVKIISTQLEVLQEILTELESIVDTGKKVVECSKDWLDETEESPKKFSEMQLLLTTEISNAMMKCSEIGNGEERFEFETENQAFRELSIQDAQDYKDNFESRLGELRVKTDDVSVSMQYFRDNMENREKEQKALTEKFDSVVLGLSSLEAKFNEKCLPLIQKCETLNNQMTVMCSDMELLKRKSAELEQSSEVVRFTAHVRDNNYLNITDTSDPILKCFTNVKSNVGNHYDPATCIFTAPCHGIYAVFLGANTISQQGNYFKMGVVKLPLGNSQWVLVINKHASYMTESHAALAELKTGEQLCVAAISNKHWAVLSEFSYFKCFMIQKF